MANSQQTLVLASDQQLSGRRSYYLVHSSQENSVLIQKFVEWMQQEVTHSIATQESAYA
ncbi:hypothetical protein [Acinetobacter indicus]|uniref:hypothetical protein n=1 Tax=Acinetobacter indicus TaxID=756892 RepID=UPI001C09C7F8|nr:hypothetical protein [Acinetobacter indicus]